MSEVILDLADPLLDGDVSSTRSHWPNLPKNLNLSRMPLWLHRSLPVLPLRLRLRGRNGPCGPFGRTLLGH